MPTIRCSSLDMLHHCTPSTIESGDGSVKISLHSDAAKLGRAVHEMSASLVESGKWSVKDTAAHHQLSEPEQDEARLLMEYARRCWNELTSYFPGARTEVKVDSDKIGDTEYTLSGTVDILSATPSGGAVFADWKSGWLDSGYYQQMAGYAHCLWCVLDRPKDVVITGVVIFLRHKYYRVIKYDAARLTEWEHNLARNVLPATDTFSPGVHCNRCSRYLTCKARLALVGGAVDAMMFDHAGKDWLAKATDMLASLTEDNKDAPEVAELVNQLTMRIKLANKAADDASAMLRGTIERVGAIPMGPDSALALRTHNRDTIIASKAMTVLRRFLSDQQICEAMRLSLPTLVDTYCNANKHGRASARKMLSEKLTEASALKTKPFVRMEVVDLEPKGKQKEISDGTRDAEHGNARTESGGVSGSA